MGSTKAVLISRIPQPVRFMLAGTLVLACDCLMFYLLVHFSQSASVSNFASRTLTIPISFYLQRQLTFTGAQAQRTTTQLWRFLLLWTAATVFGALILEAVRVPFGATMASLAKLPLELVIAFINYFAMKHWVYQPQRSL
jgi:putative flippase GtrA